MPVSTRVALFAFLVSLVPSAGSAHAAEGTRLNINYGTMPQLAGSSRAVFMERDPVAARDAIWSVQLDGSGRARISPDLPYGGLGGFRVTPDASRVVFRSDPDLDGKFRLWSAPADGSGAAIPIDGTPVDVLLADVKSFQLGEGGTQVVYLANFDVATQFELYAVPAVGGTPLRLLASLPEQIVEYRVSPASSFVVMALRNPAFTGNYNLFSARTDQVSTPLQLNTALDGPSERIWDWAISPAGGHVAWISNEDGNPIDIFSRAIGGGVRRRLNGIDRAENVRPTTFGNSVGVVISPSGGSVVFSKSTAAGGAHNNTVRAPIGGWVDDQGVPDLIASDVWKVTFSPDSGWMVLKVGDASANALYSVSSNLEIGPCRISHSPGSPNQGNGWGVDVHDFVIHPDSQLTAYTGFVYDLLTQDYYGKGLFVTASGYDIAANCNFTNHSVPVWFDPSGPLPTNATCDLPVAPAGRADFDFYRSCPGCVGAIYHVDRVGGSFWKVSLPGSPGVSPSSLQITPDGQTLVYLADYENDSFPFADVWATSWSHFRGDFESGSTSAWSMTFP